MDVECDLTSTTNPPEPIRLALANSYQFSLSDDDLQRLMEMRRTFYQKEKQRKLTKLGLPILNENGSSTATPARQADSTERPIRRRDMEWLAIILPFVKLYNPHCGVCASGKNYGRRLDMSKSYLLRSYFYCQGRDCPFNCTLTVKENGKGLISARLPNGNIVDHRNAKRVARPNRSLNKTTNSSEKKSKRTEKSVSPTVQQWNDASIDVFDLQTTRKTSSTNFASNLLQLVSTLRDEIDPHGVFPGALQHLSLTPFSLIVHTEKSLRFYQNLLSQKASAVLQFNPNQNFNASGQIIVLNHEKIHGPHQIVYLLSESMKIDEKKFVYYELMLNHLDDRAFVPISFALIESTDDLHQQNFALRTWFNRIRFDHEHLYKSSFPTVTTTYRFPHPFLVLIDDHRENPLNNALLNFFNHESFRDYILRTYLLVSPRVDCPSQDEAQNRVLLHRSASSMINEFRQLVTKYVPNELRQLALWSSLLLLQSQTWRDVRLSWTLICEIFLNWGTNLVSLKSYEDLCDRVSKMENDPELSHLLDLIYIGNSSTVDDNAAETLNEDDPIDGETIDLTDFQNDHLYTKNIFNYESQLYVSPYETELRRIFNEKNQSKSALISSWETLSLDDRTVLRKIRGNYKWLDLLLKEYIPSIPIWSNLIFSISTNNFKTFQLNKRISRFTLNKDKRLNQIKRIQLAERVHGKSDLTIANLAKDFHQKVLNANNEP